jgi:hypothetical protein
MDADKYEILLTSDEMMIITNCMNEVCNGIDVPEFSTRIGAEKDEVESMLDSLLAVSRG